MGRFSQAISEGDGISVVPLLQGDVAELAARAEAAGAEAVAVSTEADAARARAHTRLPILVRDPDLNAEEDVRYDACILVFERLAGEPYLEDLHASLIERGLDSVVDVRSDDELEEALARVDPEIILVSERDPEPDEHELERALDLLPSVPAGKLVVAESRSLAREQVLALERAGVDAVLVSDLGGEGPFEEALEELVGGPRPHA